MWHRWIACLSEQNYLVGIIHIVNRPQRITSIVNRVRCSQRITRIIQMTRYPDEIVCMGDQLDCIISMESGPYG